MTSEAKDIVRQDCDRILDLGAESFGDIGDSRILITGGTGFMGSWIAEMVLRLNETRHTTAKVFLLGRDRGRFERNLGHLAESPFVEFIRCDVRNVADIPKEIDYVIHAAGTPDNRMHATNPIETMVTIAEGTHAILSAADRVSNLKMFVNVSSSSIYGAQPLDLPRIAESYSGVLSNSQVAASYAEAKRYGEALSNAARSEARIPVVVVRPFSFAGAYQPLDAPWAVNNFIRDALNKHPIRILGDGQTIRSVMYGADMALWMLAIMSKAKAGQVFNVGSDEGISIERLAAKVASRFVPAPEVLLNTSLSGSIPNTIQVPDTSKAKEILNLRVLTNIDLSLERSILWYKHQ
jgi:nucleoside-diphosphate-sugar epimerase